MIIAITDDAFFFFPKISILRIIFLNWSLILDNVVSAPGVYILAKSVLSLYLVNLHPNSRAHA